MEITKQKNILIIALVVLIAIIISVILLLNGERTHTHHKIEDNDPFISLDSKNKDSFLFSNLVDNESKLKVKALLSEHDIPQKNIELLLNLIDEFYSVPYNNIVQQGWETANISTFSYDEKDAFAHLDEQPDNLTICRFAAFIILKDSIDFREPAIYPVANKDSLKKNEFEEEKDWLYYNLLFSNIDNVNIDSSETLAKTIAEYWDTVGIHFSESKVKFVMAYGDTMSGIQNFHTAVVIYTDENIWLLEKFDPIYPYQLSCFNDQEQIIDYMKKRVSEIEHAAIFINDSCIWQKIDFNKSAFYRG